MNKSRQSGFASYIFLVIAMLSMVALATAKMSRSGGQQQWNFESRVTLLDQSKLIRNRIIACGINYPAGNNGSGFHPRFPLTPLTTFVDDLVCPGQAAPNNLWTGVGGLTLPASPKGFSKWSYANDGTNVRISIQAANGVTDKSAMNVLTGVASRLGSNASVTGSVLTIILMI